MITEHSLTLLRTGDGSHTLLQQRLDEPYHSRRGAVAESTHVYIKAGLERATQDPVRILEVGLGTGLNVLLTWIRCLEGKCRVVYTALEPFPLDRTCLERLAHAEELAWPGLHQPFLRLMTSPEGQWTEAEAGFRFRWLNTSALDLDEAACYDLVYFDAFAPRKQPELWTQEVFRRMRSALIPGGALVTYCAKGAVRRAMEAAGFRVERLPGPPGKREMLRAIHPVP